MAAFDAEQIARAVRKEAVRHQELHQRLSRVVGPVEGFESMTLPELAAYGLEKLNLTVPDATDDPRVIALEFALRGRSGHEMGAGMDMSASTFLDRYLGT